MSDVAYTLQIGRKAFPYRRYLVCADRQDAITALGQEDSKRVTFQSERRIAPAGDLFVAGCRRSVRGHGATISMKRGPFSKEKSIDARKFSSRT